MQPNLVFVKLSTTYTLVHFNSRNKAVLIQCTQNTKYFGELYSLLSINSLSQFK